MSPFDYVKSINETKENLIVDDLTEKGYAPFVVNRALSYFLDTVFQANEMNRNAHLSKKTQYNFLLNSVRKRKRWAGKWHKQEAASENIQALMQYYGYSEQKSNEVLPLFSAADLKEIRKRLDPGGA
jgi:hypothetical protein